MRIPCTCGCGLQVTHATKINHLNGRGKTSLRARVLEENESLKQSTRQQPVLQRDHQNKKRSHPSSNQIGNHKRLKVAQLNKNQIPETSLLEDADPMGSLSLSVPNEESEILPAEAYTDPTESPPTPVPNQVAKFPTQMYTDPTESPSTSAPNQVPDFPIQAYTDPTELPHTPVMNHVPEIPPVQACTDIMEPPYTPVPVSQADAGPEEFPPAPEPNIEDVSGDALSSVHRSSRIAERTRQIAEQRWGNSHLRDEISRFDFGGSGHRNEDEEDLITIGDEDSDDEDSDKDSDDEDSNDEDINDEDDGDDLFAESDVNGISAWDLLGEGFEREVASRGMFLAHESSVLLTII